MEDIGWKVMASPAGPGSKPFGAQAPLIIIIDSAGSVLGLGLQSGVSRGALSGVLPIVTEAPREGASVGGFCIS